MSAAPILTIQKDGETLKSQAIDGEVVIGRGEGCVIRLDDRAVSRSHARIKRVGDGVEIERQSEFAPLQVNGVECSKALLRDGDVVAIGPYRLRLAGEAPKTAGTPAPVEPASAVPIELGAPEAPAALAVPIAPPSAEGGETRLLDALATEVPATNAAPIPELPTLGIEPIEPLALEGAPESEPSPTLEAPFPGLPIEPPESASASENDATALLSAPSAEAVSAAAGTGDAADLPFQFDESIFDNPVEGVHAAPIEVATGQVSLDGPPTPSPAATLDLQAEDPEASAGPVDEDAKTSVQNLAADVKLVFQSGSANVETFPITKKEITIGRGKNCDIVLNDKKASRKNSLIVREGNRYIIRDLDSVNGTFVNGKSVKEKALSTDDHIRVGDIEFSFLAIDRAFEKRADDFLPIAEPSDAVDAFASPLAGDAGAIGDPLASPISPLSPGSPTFMPTAAAAAPGVPPLGIAGIDPQQNQRKGVFGAYDKYVKNFGQLKPMQKVLVLLCAGYFAMWYLEEDPTTQIKRTDNRAQATAKPGEKDARGGGFANLNPEQRKFVENQYQLAFEFYTKHDFDKSLYEVQKIFPLVPDYERGKELERYALEGKRKTEALEEERKKKEDEARLKARVAELVETTRELMAKKDYEHAKDSFGEILTIEPDNTDVEEWKKEIEAYLEEKDRLEKERLVQEEINKRALDTYNEAFELHKAGKYREAIEVYEKVAEMGASDRKLLAKSKTMISACQDSIRDLRDPVLARAKELEGGGDLAQAYREYEKATRIDPPHPVGYQGMERIRGILNDRAKVVYTEAVIAESYSDFTAAERKYRDVMRIAPEGSLYFQRAQRRLTTYLNFRNPAGDHGSPDSSSDGASSDGSSSGGGSGS